MRMIMVSYSNFFIGLNKFIFKHLIIDFLLMQEPLSQVNVEEAAPCRKRKRLRILSNEERTSIYHELLQKSVDGKLRKYATKEVALASSVSLKTIQRIWKRGKESETHDVSHRKTKNCGRKRITIDEEKIREVPLRQRTSI